MCVILRYAMHGSRGGTGGHYPPEKSQTYWVSWFGSGSHEATKSAFNVGPSSARKRNAILMAFRWRADDGPLLLAFSLSPSLSVDLSPYL